MMTSDDLIILVQRRAQILQQLIEDQPSATREILEVSRAQLDAYALEAGITLEAAAAAASVTPSFDDLPRVIQPPPEEEPPPEEAPPPEEPEPE